MVKKIFLIIGLMLGSVIGVSAQHIEKQRIDAQIDSVLNSLTLREKIAQLVIVAINSKNSSERKAQQDTLVSMEGIGGLIVMDDNLAKSMDRANELQRMAKVPLLMTIDGEWGPSMRYDEFPNYPRQMQLGALSSDTLIYKMGRAIGQECLSVKIQVNFAPTIDINNNPDNPVIHVRSFGEDKEKVANYGVAYMKGMQDVGLYTSAKHFPGHGDTNVDSHKGLPVLTFDRERLDSLELYPFRKLIDEGVAMVMMAHLSIPSLDETGTPSSISKPIVTGLLREELGYNGIIITDALGMKGVSTLMSPEKVTLEAYKAGVDILLMPNSEVKSIAYLEEAFNRGELSVDELDAKVRKMLRMKAESGMLEPDYCRYVDTTKLEEKTNLIEHHALIEEMSKKSLTLVKNDGVLPLKNLSKTKIAYLGYKYDNSGEAFSSVLNRYGDIDIFTMPEDASVEQLKELRQKVAKYDLVIVGFHGVGIRPYRNFDINEECSSYFGQWAKEQDLIGVYFGSPYALNKLTWHKDFRAFLVCYSNSIPNSTSAAQLLYGGIPALGELPVGTDLYHYGFSEIIPQATRLEFVMNSLCDVYRVEGGKVYGTSIKDADGKDLMYNTPVMVSEKLLSKGKMKRIGAKLGMNNSRFDQKTFTTTLDDLSKLCFALMNDGMYGGEKCISDGDKDKLYSKMIALYGAERETLRYIFNTDKGELVLLMDLEGKNIEFVVNK